MAGNRDVLDAWLVGGVERSRSMSCGEGMLFSYNHKIAEIDDEDEEVTIWWPETATQTVKRHIQLAKKQAELMDYVIVEEE